MRRLSVLAVIACLTQAAGASPSLQQPARDRRAQPPVGTARLRGVVTAADTGAPLRGAQLTLSAANSRVQKTAATDANGQYEFSELPAARYSLTGQKPGYVAMRFGAAGPLQSGKSIEVATGQTLAGINLALPRGSVISGRVLDDFGEPVLDATVRVMRYQSTNGQRRLVPVGRPRLTDDLGEYRIFGLMPGSYYVTAVARDPDTSRDEPDGAAAELPRYAPTFYPGTPDVSGAQRVTVLPGETRANISFPLTATRTARISGLATDSRGQAAAGAGILLARREGAIGFRPTVEGRVKPDGTFEIADVAPGRYVLQINANAIPVREVREFAFVPVQVAGLDIDGLAVRTAPGANARGRIVLDGVETARFPFAEVDVRAQLAVSDFEAAGGRSATARVARDGTFQLTNIAGPVLIRALRLPAAWSLKAVTLGADDITDTPYEFKPGEDLGELTVVLTDRTTWVSGTATGCQELSDQGCSVLVFSTDTSRWGPQTRFVRIVRPNQQGAYTVRGLPTGTYLATAIPYVWQGEWYDRDFLDQLQPYATRIVLADGPQTGLNLTAVLLGQ